MNITVAGLWHLGCVTSACCAEYFQVTGFDPDPQTIAALSAGKAPLLERGLDDLIQAGITAGKLKFENDRAKACGSADILWVTFDTPVDDEDESDVESVLQQIRQCAEHLRPEAVVLVSSQLPVGTCRRLESEFPGVTFAYSPENLQLGKALVAFRKADRIIAGTRSGSSHPALAELFAPFCDRIIWMRTESAEMVKHGLNAFLALSITFINELAAVCEKTGADAAEVSQGLKSDVRIGPKAYLSAGGPFAGGTLARDVVSLTNTARAVGERLDVIPAIKTSNDWHKGWAIRRLRERLTSLRHRRITLLGLTYKPDTDTLRRSQALELAATLSAEGASIVAFDPAVRALPADLAGVLVLAEGVDSALDGSDAVVICTEWRQFREVDWQGALRRLRRPLILDANGFLKLTIPTNQVEYLCVGRAA